MRKEEKSQIAHGYSCLVGIDEAGRGPLAGPVVASAVHLPLAFESDLIHDSKELSPKKRDLAYEEILRHGQVGIGIVSAELIDELNILQATFLAMKMAIDDLHLQPELCLVDGSLKIPGISYPQKAIISGDASCFLIAAASIVAKVTRDRIMENLHQQFPEYGFAQHKGYPTKAHREVLERLGPTPYHRLTFHGVRRSSVS